MALDPTARESNFRDSIKKYVIDSLKYAEDIQISFDKSIGSAPKLQGREVDKWVTINIGAIERGSMSEADIHFYPSTRQDEEGFKLAQLGDKVVGILSDTSMTDGIRRIALYRSHPTDPWEVIGHLLVCDVKESPQYMTTDETKYKQITARIKWASKI